MEGIIRKGIAFEQGLLEQFDQLIKERKYKNRSEAIRDLIRKELLKEQQANPEQIMMATLTIVFDHHKNKVQEDLTEAQHNHPHLVRSTLHVHIDHDNCLEVILLEGKVKHIQQLAHEIIATKGVKNGKLVLTNV